MNYRILVVDNEEFIRKTIIRYLTPKQYDLETAASGKEALNALETFHPDLMLLDFYLDDMNALEIMAEAKRRELQTLCVVMTAFPDIEIAVNAMKEGAYDFISKPFTADSLQLSLDKALETIALKKEVEALRQLHMEKNKSGRIIGDSSEMKHVLHLVERFAKTDVTVLVEGEPGTGKELIAEYIHYSSNRFSKPFVPINCGAIPGTLFESELFGYVKGAFTGANSSGKVGTVEKADTGTLFLDEINSMPIDSQVKLLRLLENHEYYRVGDPDVRSVDTRIIAACNTDLEEEVRKGKFRQDLYFRLNIAKVIIPPLRNRRTDTIPLVNYFLVQANERFGANIKGFTKKALNVLLSLPLEGNVRELRNLIERVTILANSNIITINDLKLAGIHHGDNSFHIRVELNRKDQEGNIIQLATKDIINKTLEIAGDNKTKAAELLGIPRSTLRHHLTK
ncbi:sigma-54-dependent Fis family transcriptional regulator [bacterium]|nr:sigma-54-dependent Fis family transcriptional regulator [bacterium]